MVSLRLMASGLIGSVLIAAASCGGGGGGTVATPPSGNNNNNGSTTTGLTGQITQDAKAPLSSTGLSGATVTAIDGRSGKVAETTTISTNGKFNFKNIQVGNYLLRVNFNGNKDLDRDGNPDTVDLLIPVTVQETAGGDLTLILAGVDTDKDGQSDSIMVKPNIRGKLRSMLAHWVNYLRHEVVTDKNNNGQADDDGDPDSDNDGIPDDGSVSAPGSFTGGTFSGAIQAFDAGYIRVSGVTLLATDATRYLNYNGTTTVRSFFSVGTQVIVRAVWNGTAWLATEVRLAQASAQGVATVYANFGGVITGLAGNVLSLGENKFNVTTDTAWTYGGSRTSNTDLFDVGDYVYVRGYYNGSQWLANSVIMMRNVVRTGEPGGVPTSSTTTVTKRFSGEVQAVGDAYLTVYDVVIRVNDRTTYDWKGNAGATLSKFKQGDEVMLTATWNGKIWIASNVTLIQR
jgi:hypothetical protein